MPTSMSLRTSRITRPAATLAPARPAAWQWALVALLSVHLLGLLVLCKRTKPWLTGDSPRYLALAASLREGRGFALGRGAALEPEAMRLPGYPAFIAACQTLPGSARAYIIVAQVLLYLASLWLTWRLAATSLGPNAGAAFLSLSALYPF